MTADDSDALRQWMLRARDGDEAAATELVRHYEPELRRFVHYRLTDFRLRRLLDSLDVTQSVFARFFTALGEGRLDVSTPRQLMQLLRTMAANRLRDHTRRRKAAKRSLGDEDRGAEIPVEEIAGGGEPSQAVLALDLVDALRQQLDDDERVILDRRIDGHGWADLAQEMQCTPDAVRKRFTRAVDRAAERLGLS